MRQITSFVFEHYNGPFIARLPAFYRVLGAKIQLTANSDPLYIDIVESDVVSSDGTPIAVLFCVFTTSDLIPPGAVFVCKIETPYDWKDARYLYEIPDELPF
jgi:hypothetical protein